MNTTFAWGLLSVMGIAGCATTETAGVGPGAAPASPASLEAGRSFCRAAAPTQVVASHVFVPTGVDASLEDGIATLRFALRKGQCAASHVELVSGRFATEDAPEDCPGSHHDVVATSEGETLLARESHEDARASHIELGVVVYEVPSLLGFTSGRRPQHVVEHAFEPPEGSHEGGEKNPALVPLPGERFLLLWVDGDENGHRLHGQPVAGWGAPAGRAVDLSSADVSVIGRPSGAIGPDGRGVVAFIGSSGDGFNVFATPVVCE